MTDQSSPPDALRAQWRTEAPIYRDFGVGRENWLMNRAARWGWDQRGTINEAQLQERADQELEACCVWVRSKGILKAPAFELHAARRPKPPSLKELKERALAELEGLRGDANSMGMGFDAPAIRLALEALPND